MTLHYLSLLFAPSNLPNDLLALVGILGTILAVRTLRYIGVQAGEMKLQRMAMRNTLHAIKRQADAMEKQTAALEESISVARASAEAAQKNIEVFIDKERGRLRFEVSELDWRDSTRDQNPEAAMIPRVSFCLRHSGETGVSVKDATAEMKISDSNECCPTSPGRDLRVPRTIDERTEIKCAAVEIKDVSGKTFFEVNARQKFVHFYGAIRYRDIFGLERVSSFYYVWYPSTTGHRGWWEKLKCEGFDQET